jgi:transposase
MALINLKPREAALIEQFCRNTANAKQSQRAQALLWLDEGDSVEEIAERLRVSRQTIYNWAARFIATADLPMPERLSDAARSGRPPTALEIIDPLIELVIDLDPRLLDYNSTVWTADLLRQYLSEQHQTPVSIKSVQRALRRLDLTWKRPRHVLARRAPHWRQAKGGSNKASGHTRGRSS